jgi:tetratricopeptide (TPR) repeat protein
MLRQGMIRILAIAMLALAHAAAADPAADRLTGAGIAEFRDAYRAWDADGFRKAADKFGQAAKHNPSDPRIHYWRGTAWFHLMLQLRSQQPPREKPAGEAMEEAVKSLESAVMLDPRDAESHAMLGTLYGMKIHGGMLRAIRFGPRVHEHQKQALAHGARNPRVRYLLGAARFHTAKNQADFRQALATLLEAEKLFSAEAAAASKDATAPRWGRSSCLTFIGRCYLRLGDRKNAAAYFRKALAAHPNDHVAKRELDQLTAN